jgi:hypothetical protein
MQHGENRVRPPKRWEGQEVSGSDRRAKGSETQASGGAEGTKSMRGLEPRAYGMQRFELGKNPPEARAVVGRP